MSISINSFSGFSQTNSTQNTSQVALEKLSSGSKINRASDDAAGLAISQRLASQLGGSNVATRNAGDAISSIQVADGALQSLSKNIGRIQELSIQAANGSLNNTDRKGLQAEAAQLIAESNSIIKNSNFNGKSLFSSSSNTNVQLDTAGNNITLPGKDLVSEFKSLGFSSLDISSQQGATSALNVLNKATNQINSRTAELGAASNRIGTALDNLASSRINSSQARSRISDTDFAKTTSTLATNQIQDQASLAVQAQANGNRDTILKLLIGL